MICDCTAEKESLSSTIINCDAWTKLILTLSCNCSTRWITSWLIRAFPRTTDLVKIIRKFLAQKTMCFFLIRCLNPDANYVIGNIVVVLSSPALPATIALNISDITCNRLLAVDGSAYRHHRISWSRPTEVHRLLGHRSNAICHECSPNHFRGRSTVTCLWNHKTVWHQTIMFH